MLDSYGYLYLCHEADMGMNKINLKKFNDFIYIKYYKLNILPKIHIFKLYLFF